MMDNEFIEQGQEAPKETKTTKKKSRKLPSIPVSAPISQFLSGDFLAKEFVVRNLQFIFFVIFLVLLLLTKGYYAKHLLADIEKGQKELDAALAEYVESKARLEEMTQRSVLVNKLEAQGLKETTRPTKVIRIKKQEKNK